MRDAARAGDVRGVDGAEWPQAFENGDRGVGRSRQTLLDVNGAGALVVQDEIGERAPDVAAQPIRRPRLAHRSLPGAARLSRRAGWRRCRFAAASSTCSNPRSQTAPLSTFSRMHTRPQRFSSPHRRPLAPRGPATRRRPSGRRRTPCRHGKGRAHSGRNSLSVGWCSLMCGARVPNGRCRARDSAISRACPRPWATPGPSQSTAVRSRHRYPGSAGTSSGRPGFPRTALSPWRSHR